MRLVALAGLIALAGCAELGRYPGQSDASCMHMMMGPPRYLTFEAAAGAGCQRLTPGLPFTGDLAERLPLNLHGAPDLQAQARANGFAYTE